MPSNFRPITLSPVLGKVMTSLLRNRMYTFLLLNEYIETDLQKGFWSELSGTVEHTELLSHLVKHARKKQKQLVVTLLDLKNAFGEVHHELIKKILKYHHIPDEVISLVTSLYTDFVVSISTDEFTTNPIVVNRGVLQGDSLSPLLFNLIVNTLIQTIKNKKIECLGYSYHEALRPKHWFQFADDTAIVTALEQDNQLLCNAFTKWSSWADLSIRVEKCHTFGIKKSSTASVQYQPRILVNNKPIPPTDIDDNFTYLGKDFNFNMSNDHIKSDLINYVSDVLIKCHSLPLTPLNKLSVIQRYVYSKLRWKFSIYDLTETWVVRNIDNQISKFVRLWLRLHAGANLTHISLQSKKLGLRFTFAKKIYQQCKLSVRRILKMSKNTEIRKLYEITSNENVRSDEIINSCKDPVTIKTRSANLLRNKIDKSTWNDFMSLKEQNKLISHLVKECPVKMITIWQCLVRNLPSNIFQFCRRALILSLPNNSNLLRWKITVSGNCGMCNKLQTQLHTLSNCSSQLDRFKWRHDSVLRCIYNFFLPPCLKNSCKLFIDCPELGLQSPSELFQTLRPDIVIQNENEITAIELTICYETNTSKSRSYKQTRYKHLESDLRQPCSKFTTIYLEITTLGFMTSNTGDFLKLAKKVDVDVDRLIYKCGEVCIRSSYYIFCRRNKSWEKPALLDFL